MAYASHDDRIRIEAESPWADRDVPTTTFDMLQGTAQKYGDRPALTFQMFSDPGSAEQTLTWHELEGRTAQVANLLRSLGIGESDVVAYMLPNCHEAVETYLGGQTAGIVSPLNPLLEAEQLAGIMRDTNAKVLVTLKSFPKSDVAQKAAEAVRLAPNVKTVIEVDLLRYITGIKRFIVPLVRPKNPVEHKAKVIDYAAEVARQPKTLAFDPSHNDRPAAYFHTGGTTGLPKVAQHSFSGIVYNAWLGEKLLFSSDDVQICPLPMFHVFAAIVCVGASLSSGAQIVFPTPAGYRGDGVFDNFWKLVERYKVTFVITVPTAMSVLMQKPVDADISSLRLAFCGSAPLPVQLYKRFEETADVTVCEGYGLTEATCLVSINPPDGEKKVGSIGIPFPHSDIKIFNTATGKECAARAIGEICVSNPGVSLGHTYTDESKNVDLYYPGDLSETQYLRTGDLGRIDRDGYLWITGRAKDLIIRGGHNIDPADIEEALAGHPAVAFAGAIGQPDAHSGEIPCAYVELVEGAETSVDDLMAFAEANISERAAVPKYLEVLDELPKTAVGKIFKPDLRKRAIKRIFDQALANGDIAAEVASVEEDKRLGLVAKLNKTGTVTDEDVIKGLGAFATQWVWAD